MRETSLGEPRLTPEEANERDWLNAQIREVAQAADAETYWKGPFQIGDVMLQDEHYTVGGYRRSDGWFSLKIGIRPHP